MTSLPVFLCMKPNPTVESALKSLSTYLDSLNMTASEDQQVLLTEKSPTYLESLNQAFKDSDLSDQTSLAPLLEIYKWPLLKATTSPHPMLAVGAF